MQRSRLRAVAWLGFIAVTAAIALRTYLDCNVVGQPALPRFGMQDFRDAIYYPARAFLDGVNAYDPHPYLRLYPAGLALGPYTPAVLLLYAPLALLGARAAAVVFFLINTGFALALAATILAVCGLATTTEAVLGLATALLLSHPGHSTLFLGQCTFYVLTAAFLARHWAHTRPAAAALAFAVALLKPTFGVPLGLLMLCLGEWQPVVAGGLLCAVASLLALARLVVAADVPTVVRGVFASLDLLAIGLNRSHTSLRIDVPGLVERFTGIDASGAGGALVTLAVLILGVVTVRRAARDGIECDHQLIWALVCLIAVTCTYHQGYDAVMLALPATALAAGSWRPRLASLGAATRWLLLACLVFPGLNYVSTYHFAARFGVVGAAWLALASANGAAITLALLLCIALAGAGPDVAPARRAVVSRR